METIKDFEDMLILLEKHGVRYLIVGGLAFIYHAKPRYTKDMDIWMQSSPDNVEKANRALKEFGSPFLVEPEQDTQIVQIGVAPNRIDIIRTVEGVGFEEAWKKRAKAPYGKAHANWIDLDSLIRIKAEIDHPRHKEDVRTLLEVKRLKKKR